MDVPLCHYSQYGNSAEFDPGVFATYMLGKTHFGSFSPAKPAFRTPDPWESHRKNRRSDEVQMHIIENDWLVGG